MTVTNAPVMYDTTAAKLQYSANGTQIDVPGSGSGDMLKSTYDAANIAQQVAGTTATQILTNKTINGASNTLTVRLANDVSGTLPVNHGGSGQTTYTNGQVLIGNTTGNTLSKATLTAGSGISITNGAGSITIAATGGAGNVFNVLNYGADPTGASSSQTAFSNAIIAAKTSIAGPGYASNTEAAIIYVPKGVYTGIASLDLTGLVGVTMQGEGSWGSALYANGQSTSGPVIDMTGSSYCMIKGINVFGMNTDGTAPTVKPLAAFLLAATSADGDSNANRLDDCQGIGYFNSAPLCVIGSVVNQFYSCRFQQSNLQQPTLNLSTTHDWSITSPFKTIVTNAANVGKNSFFGCEFHGAKSSSADCWTLYFRNLDIANFHGCLIDCSANNSSAQAHIIIQGSTNNVLSFFGSSFYTESGHSAGHLLQVDSYLGNFLTHGCTENGAYSSSRLTGTSPSAVSNL